MKKTIALLLALAMVLSLCACGSNSEPVAAETQASAAEPSVQEETPQETAELEASADTASEPQYTKDDVLGKWFGVDTRDYILIEYGNILYTGTTLNYPDWDVVDDKIVGFNEELFTIVETDDGIQLIGTHDRDTHLSAAAYQKLTGLKLDATKDDVLGEWYCEENDITLVIDNGELVFDGSNHWGPWSIEDGRITAINLHADIVERDGVIYLDGYDLHIWTGEYTRVEEPVEPEVQSLQIGEIASTDSVEFTMDSYQFGHKLSTDSNPNVYHLPTDENKGLSAGDGNVYITASNC